MPKSSKSAIHHNRTKTILFLKTHGCTQLLTYFPSTASNGVRHDVRIIYIMDHTYRAASTDIIRGTHGVSLYQLTNGI